jgi:large subunit ribosomal protein L24
VIKLKIRKGDTVQVVAGADKGKKGEVIAVDPKSMKIKVQGVRVQTHFDKKEGQLKKEGLIDYSNVKLVSRATAEKETKAAKKSTKRKSA